MKAPLRHLLALFTLLPSLAIFAHAQITPLGDSYTNTADPTTNYGAKTTVNVDGATEIGYIQFDLSGIPSGATVSQAMLKLYVGTVTTAGSFDVDYVNGSWAESTIDASNAPALGNNIASNVSIVKASVNQYILVNVTSAVQAWLNGTTPNDGIALVANSTTNVAFDSKESTTTSHSPELDIVYGGIGTLTGVTTASGSGLTGGGTSGTLSLGLTTGCSANQVLAWSGSAWACATAGTGTVTGLTAGTGITVGTGSTPSVAINTSVVPQLSVANTFTGNQTVSGNLTATGVVTGSSFQIGSNLFAYGSYTNNNAFLGFAGNATMTGVDNTGVGGLALAANTTGGSNTASGVAALNVNTTGSNNTADGYEALMSNTASDNTAIGERTLFANTTGTNNTATGQHALENNTTASQNTANGESALASNTTGSSNSALGYSAGDTFDSSSLTGGSNTAVGAFAYLSTGTLTNATAIGANAEVAESNALVLGSINGVNGATASTSVGIGTTTPAYSLDVHGTGNFTGLVTFASGQTFPGTGTITGVTGGTGLSGSGTSGTVTLTNTGILALTAGTGVSSTGGQSPTLSINTSVVPELSAANTFSKNLSTSGELAAGGTAGGDTANGTVEVDAGSTNTGTYSPGLNFGGGGQSIASDRAGTVNVKGIDFYTNFVNRMSLTNGGNLGIGTTSPTHLFEVDAAATAAQLAMVSSGTDAAISVKNTGSGGREYWIDSGSSGAGIGSGNFAVFDATASAIRFVINSSGEVGIGTAIPGYQLDVESSSTVYNLYAGNHNDANFSAAVYGSEDGSEHEDIGVWGFAASSIGIGSYSEGWSSSTTGGEFDLITATGSWADTGQDGGQALLATADNGYGIYAVNNSTLEEATPTAFLQNANTAGYVLVTAGPSPTGPTCYIDNDANLTCNGKISNAVPVGNAGKQVALYGVAAAENWFEDAGSGQLSNGAAVIYLEATFAQTVNTGVDYHVFLTPNGDCKGLYVTQKTATSFEVHELGGGTSNIAFDWRIMAKRAGFETARLEDKTPNPAMLQRLKRRPAGTHGPSPDDVRKAHMQKITELRSNAGATATAKPAPR